MEGGRHWGEGGYALARRRVEGAGGGGGDALARRRVEGSRVGRACPS